jgi:hypothetical protein
MQYPDLSDELNFLYEDLTNLFPVKEAQAAAREAGSKNMLLEKLEKALVACTEFDSDAGMDIVKELQAYDFGGEIDALLNESMSAFKDFDIDGAEAKLKKIIMENI